MQGLLNPAKVIAIVQARMTSTRLPGKVLMPVMGRPLLRYELERLRRISCIDEIIVATTTNIDDDPVIEFCERMGVKTCRGSEHDVLSRYYEAVSLFGADVVVRFTADCPLIDPVLASSVIESFLSRDELDYIGIDYDRIPHGMDTEVFTVSALSRAYNEGRDKPDREHVTWYLHTNPDKFNVARYSIADDWGIYRLTVDTPEDFELIKILLERLYPDNPDFTLRDIVSLLEREPSLVSINRCIKQKQ